MSDKSVIMSDMSSSRITVRLPESLTSRLRTRSRSEGRSESKVVRQALEQYLAGSAQSAYDLAKEAGVVGVIKSVPKDLSTSRRHFKGFGQDR